MKSCTDDIVREVILRRNGAPTNLRVLEMRDRKKSRVEWNMGLFIDNHPRHLFNSYTLSHHVNGHRVVYSYLLRNDGSVPAETNRRDKRPAIERCSNFIDYLARINTARTARSSATRRPVEPRGRTVITKRAYSVLMRYNS